MGRKEDEDIKGDGGSRGNKTEMTIKMKKKIGIKLKMKINHLGMSVPQERQHTPR